MKALWNRLLTDHGMVLVLVMLAAFFSWATFTEQQPGGVAGARSLMKELARVLPDGGTVLVVVRNTPEDVLLGETLIASMTGTRWTPVQARPLMGTPADLRSLLEPQTLRVGAFACSPAAGEWTVFDTLRRELGGEILGPVVTPARQRWPLFLAGDNLLNVANQIAVIAIIAIGMTLVIVAGGIDLSVGSLIALAAVIATRLIRDAGGGESAGTLVLIAASLAAIALCGGVGLLSGWVVTGFGVPPFIATLAMMLVASGLAFITAEGQSIYQVPDAFVGLGRGAWLGVPNAVWLMAGLYLAAHVVMTRSVFGRHVYAVGGNAEAARLSGVPVRRIRTITYIVSASLAGLGGVVMASQLKSGAPTYGQMYELYVIAAVVVGGTSLTGGRGRVLGTLVGALIIAVIRNGMNLTGVESYAQMVVLGLVILAAVLLDTIRHRGWRAWDST